MRINVGCGRRPLAGCVNIDRRRYPEVDYSQVQFFEGDYREWRPAPAGRVTEVRAEQFLEHLPRDEGLEFLRWCHGLLAPHGVLHITVPDLNGHLQDVRDGVQRVSIAPWLHPVRAQPPYRPEENILLFVLYGEGHCMVYNESMLRAALEHAGFAIESLTRPDGANLAVEARPVAPREATR